MIESPILKKMRAETLHHAILAVLKDRFGRVPRNLGKLLEGVLNEKKLTALIVFAGKCRDLEAFREALLESLSSGQSHRLSGGEQPTIESPWLEKMIAEQKHNIICAVLKIRFGSEPDDLRKLLEVVTDVEKLREINILAVQCPTLEAFSEGLISCTNRKRSRRVSPAPQCRRQRVEPA